MSDQQSTRAVVTSDCIADEKNGLITRPRQHATQAEGFAGEYRICEASLALVLTRHERRFT